MLCHSVMLAAEERAYISRMLAISVLLFLGFVTAAKLSGSSPSQQSVLLASMESNAPSLAATEKVSWSLGTGIKRNSKELSAVLCPPVVGATVQLCTC